MRLKKIDLGLENNKKLAVCENVKSGEQLEYSEIVGVFGKNGIGKTRVLQTVYNTIKHAIDTGDENFVDGITEDANKKVLFLEAKKILEIKNGDIELLTESGCKLFDEKQIIVEGMQKYLIKYGKSLLRTLGTQWYQVRELPRNHPAKVFSQLFSEYFGVEFKTVLNPESIRPNVQIDSLDIEQYELSDGEWIVVFYLLLVTLCKCTGDRYSDAIIIIDELENYLNPGNIKKVFKAICDSFSKKGQIWIASHSLDVLLLINTRQVYRLEKVKLNDGARKTVINKPSLNNYDMVKAELYGDEETALSNQRFREEEMAHYFTEFMTQCLSEPTTVKFISQNDIQLRLFLDCLGTEQKEIKILDFGAGEGRIGEAIRRLKDDRLSYYAYDINERKIKSLLKKKYIKKAYYRKEDITEKFEIILLCNVLHEIPVWYWECELKFILDKLSDNGSLIFIEDLELPIGEYIGETGFLLLDGEMTQELFGKGNVSIVVAKEEKYKKRILCAVVNKESSVSKKSITSALSLLNKRNIEKVWQVRRKPKDKFVLHQRDLGNIMARAAQLVVNSEIAMEYVQAVGWQEVELLQKFVVCFDASIGLIDVNKGLVLKDVEKVLMKVWEAFEKEGNESWIYQANAALTGSLLQRLNHVLEEANMKIYAQLFESVIEQYSKLKISEMISENEYKKLMTRLVFLDLSDKYE